MSIVGGPNFSKHGCVSQCCYKLGKKIHRKRFSQVWRRGELSIACVHCTFTEPDVFLILDSYSSIFLTKKGEINISHIQNQRRNINISQKSRGTDIPNREERSRTLENGKNLTKGRRQNSVPQYSSRTWGRGLIWCRQRSNSTFMGISYCILRRWGKLCCLYYPCVSDVVVEQRM